MSFFSRLWHSLNKSSRLRKLQLKIAPPGQSVNDLVSDVMCSLKSGTNEKERALEEFLDLCESDEAVKEAMRMEHLTRADLMQLYAFLSASGLGQWVKGHYAALSTIAYVEPLLYATRAKKRGVDWREIAINLLDYWEGNIPHGGLWRQVQ